jgi:hypothetical protein
MKKFLAAGGILVSIALAGTNLSAAQAALADAPPVKAKTIGLNVPQLGTAKTYAILAESLIENFGYTDTASKTGGNDLGISTTTRLIGWDDRNIVGWYNFNNEAARKAQDDLTKAYVKASVLPATTINSQLGGRTLKPGVYVSRTGQFWITGTLTLDTLGNPNARFVFRVNDSLRTSRHSRVVIKGGKVACNVFWRVPGIVTLQNDSIIYGHVMSNTFINTWKNVRVSGQLLARHGGVTVNDAVIDNHVCRD